MKSLAKTLCVVCLFATQTFAKSPADKIEPAALQAQTQPQAQSSDECAYDFPNAKSALDAQSKDFSSVKKVIKNNKEKILTQKAVLKKDKTKVEFTTGGCTHYGYSFTYSNLGQPEFTADQAFRKVIEMLKATPTTVEGQALTKTLIEALAAAAMNKIFRPPNAVYDVPCGDAQCSLDASVKGQLKAGYSFAL